MCSHIVTDEGKNAFQSSLYDLEPIYRSYLDEYVVPNVFEAKRKVLVKYDSAKHLAQEKFKIDKSDYVFNSMQNAIGIDGYKLTDEDLENLTDGDIVTVYFSVHFYKYLIEGKRIAGSRNEMSALKLIQRTKTVKPEVSPVKVGTKRRRIIMD